MIKEPDEKTMTFLAGLVKEAGGTGGFHVAPIYVCDHCRDDNREAFPYHVKGKDGAFWHDLCNPCFDELGCAFLSEADQAEEEAWLLYRFTSLIEEYAKTLDKDDQGQAAIGLNGFTKWLQDRQEKYGQTKT